MATLNSNEYEDSYPEDETPDYDSWHCAKCSEEFIDPEDFGYAHIAKDIARESRLYWLSPTEPLCYNCAAKAGIPPIDED